MTNVVKHFKWTPAPRGKRRIHKKPNAEEIGACRPWLDVEIRLVGPRVIVCLGATAAQALLGPSFKVTETRGQALTDTGVAPIVVATVHPSSILRGAPEDRERNLAAMVEDLRTVVRALA